jgi:hypothetical protein
MEYPADSEDFSFNSLVLYALQKNEVSLPVLSDPNVNETLLCQVIWKTSGLSSTDCKAWQGKFKKSA